MRREVVLAGAAFAALAIGAAALREPHAPGAPGDGPAATAPRGEAATGASGESARVASAPAAGEGAATRRARPASLRGTDVDGGLVVDAAGRFVATPDARRLFDYFLAASGEEPEAVLVARIRDEIDRRLSGAAARDAHALLDRYLLYRESVRAFAEEGGAAAGLEDRLAAVEALRVEAFGEEVAAALFAEEEAADRAALERVRTAARDDLSPAERERRIAELEAGLPPAERARRRAARAAIDLRQAEAELREAGGSAADVHALRASTVGPDAAARLAALDRRRAEWNDRVASYREARAAIERDPALDAAARARAIEELRAERFDETERLRVEALDALAAAD